jgi:hypothetical protein
VPPVVMMVFFMLIFVGALYFAYAPRRRALNERMSQLPLEDDEGGVQFHDTKQDCQPQEGQR